MKKNSDKEPSDLVQALVSRLEKLETKVTELAGQIDQLTRKAPASAAAPAPRATKASGEIAPQLLAVIAAAIDTVIKVPYLITSIHEKKSEDSSFDAHDWSVEGRRQIFSSHRVR